MVTEAKNYTENVMVYPLLNISSINIKI